VGARFSAPVQTGPGAYPASYKWVPGLFPGVKRPGRGVDHPPLSSARVKERVELYLYSPSGPSWTFADHFWLRKITTDPNIFADVNTGYIQKNGGGLIVFKI
jgi:hypothetical protein